MKKINLIILVLFLLLLGITSIFTINSRNITKQKSTKLILYSPHCGDERGDFIKKKAKEEINLDVKCVSAGGGAIADRLNNEKNDPQADVVMALNQIFMFQLKNNGVLDKYITKWSDEIPSNYKDRDGYFYGLGRTPILIAYNKQFINTEDAPKGWTDLINIKYKGKYSLAPLQNQTTRVYLASMLWRYFDPNKEIVINNGWNFMKKLYANSYAYDTSVSWDDVKSGTTPILINWYGDIKKQLANYGLDVGYVDDPTGSPIVAESMALIKNGPNKENGVKFIEWFGSAKIQAEYAKEFFSFGQVPLNTKALEMSSNEIKIDAKKFNEQNVDYAIMSKYLNEWLRKIELEVK